MKQKSRPMALDELGQKCLELGLIDAFDQEEDTVTIVRHGVVHFRLDLQQAEIFLSKLAEHRVAIPGSTFTSIPDEPGGKAS